MVLLSRHGAAASHARLGSSKNSIFQPPSGPLTADEGGERTGGFSKPSALRGLDIAFGLTFTIPSGVRSTPGTTGRGRAERPSRKLGSQPYSCTTVRIRLPFLPLRTDGEQNRA